MESEVDILYALPTKKFFLEGPCGRVSHAIGFASGLAENNKSITVLAGEGAENHFTPNAKITISSCILQSTLLWYLSFYARLFRLTKKHRAVVIRWRPIVPLIISALFPLRNKIWLEVNSITGINSKNPAARLIARLSITIATKLFNIIVVSNESKKQIEKISKPDNEVVVIPNGFFSTGLDSFLPDIDSTTPPSLVYFGKKQEYYDWNLLYSVSKNLKDEREISSLYIFGFDESDSHPFAHYYGQFNRSQLIAGLQKIKNPILVIHPSNTETAKGGSPMKLFEYAALALPVIIGSSLEEQASLFKNFKFYASGSEESLKSTIQKTAQNYKSTLEKSTNSREIAVHNYTWPAVTKDWANRFL